MNARNDRPEYFGAPVGYTLHDTVRIRREAEAKQAEALAQGWITAGAFFYHSLVWLGRKVVDLVDALASAAYARQAYQDLSRLDDGELAEMGLTRADIFSHLLAVMEGAPIRPQPVQGDLFAVNGRRPANSELPRTEKPTRQAA